MGPTPGGDSAYSFIQERHFADANVAVIAKLLDFADVLLKKVPVEKRKKDDKEKPLNPKKLTEKRLRKVYKDLVRKTSLLSKLITDHATANIKHNKKGLLKYLNEIHATM